MFDEQRYKETRKVTLIGSALDLVLGVAKILAGYAGSSQALIADGVHSLSDLVTDIMVLFAAKHGSRAADEDHPYGHARIETLMTVVLGIALILVALGIGYDAVRRLFHPAMLLHPGWLALAIAAISIFSKEAIYQYTMRVAVRLRSNLLRANAWHSRSDAISSVIVVIGVAGSMAGLTYLDAIATVGVVLMIARIGWDMAWHSMTELVDTGLDPGRVEKMRDYVKSMDGVIDLHMLRTRRMGADALVDVHLQVGPHLSVSEGHHISEVVRNRMIEEFDEVTDVMVHIDPENDEDVQPCGELPLRHEIVEKLRQAWAGIACRDKIENITLHYLDGKIHIDLQLSLDIFNDQKSGQIISDSLISASKSVEYIGDVRVCFH
ncbi:MAG TPA: cation transporter [Gammaproteobacteria bacterium]|nr:cation transporter [Gammaproteobacteria bacterium]